MYGVNVHIHEPVHQRNDVSSIRKRATARRDLSALVLTESDQLLHALADRLQELAEIIDCGALGGEDPHDRLELESRFRVTRLAHPFGEGTLTGRGDPVDRARPPALVTLLCSGQALSSEPFGFDV